MPSSQLPIGRGAYQILTSISITHKFFDPSTQQSSFRLNHADHVTMTATPCIAILLLYLPLAASLPSPFAQVCPASPVPSTMPVLTRAQKRQFIEHGYILLPEPLPAELITHAEAHVNWAHAHRKYNEAPRGAKKGSTKPNLNFYKPVRQATHITDLFFRTYLEALANELLGGHALLRESLGQIAFTGTSDVALVEGMAKDQIHPPGGWHIDAGHAEYKDVATDFSFLIGVALSEGQEIDENRGQFTVFPGMSAFSS